MKQGLLILLILPFFSFGQCPTNIVLSSQSDIDSFSTTYPNCTEIPGDLDILGTTIDDLTPLGVLVSVGSLKIFNTQLTNLNGLENLSLIEFQSNAQTKLVLFANFDLTDITALANVTANVPMSLEIYECQSLVNLNGLQSLSQLAGLVIGDCQSLESLEGLSENLGFYPDTSGASGLFIYSNGNLQNLDALESANNFGSDITLEITDNASLNVCENTFICSIIDSASSSIVNNNAPGCNSTTELEMACDNLSTNDFNYTQIEFYPNPTTGSLYIQGIETDRINSVEVFSVLAKKVTSFKSDIIDISELDSGVYFVKITSDLGSTTKRVIKE